jgi:4-hydroxy-3-methylbut-2-enyl diphosphate reductase IspH
VVGLSAGASTPDWVVEGVATWLRNLSPEGEAEGHPATLDAVKSRV